VARTTDPILREAREPIDAIKSRIPIVSRSLPARTDVWGRQISNEGGIGPNIISPVWLSTRQRDPLNNELLRLGVNIGDPSRIVGGVRLNDEQYRAYRNRSGQLMRNTLLPYVRSPEWRQLEPQDKEEVVDQVKRESRQQVRQGMFGGRAGKSATSDPWSQFKDAR